MLFNSTDSSVAIELDRTDKLADFRGKFYIPKHSDGSDSIYLCGNSLGLQARTVRTYVEQELADWERLGVEGHFHARNPWLPYHELLARQTANLVGAGPHEIVVMNTLSVNLHLMMVSFYRPTAERFKILIGHTPFPSDRYAVISQIKFHGLDPALALLELKPRSGEQYVRTEDIEALIKKEGQRVALIVLDGVNYYSGQALNIEVLTQAGHDMGCLVGFDLAHAVGNLVLNLHDWQVDFAAWCSYKYLNGGPGCLAGCFVHEKYADKPDLPRFAGWWGHKKEIRFRMGPEHVPIYGAEGWQLSNPPILPLAALRASLEIFEQAGLDQLRHKSKLLTGYLEFLIDQNLSGRVQILTPTDPESRGCQLSLRVARNGKELHQKLTARGVVCDWREPDVIRVAPVPLYNTFMDVYRFIEIMREAL